MKLFNPIEHLSKSLAHAAYEALNELNYEDRDWEKYYQLSEQERRSGKDLPTRSVVRRPEMSECTVVAMFPQMWGSTALGLGGVGGAAMTEAYTIVIEGPNKDLAVYWGGHFGYHLELNSEQKVLFMQDIAKKYTPSRSKVENHYQISKNPKI